MVFDQLPPGLFRVSLQESGRTPAQFNSSKKADVVEKEEELVEFN